MVTCPRTWRFGDLAEIWIQRFPMAPRVSFPLPHSAHPGALALSHQPVIAEQSEPVGGGTSQNTPTSRKKGKRQLLALNASQSHLLSVALTLL